MLPGNAPHRIPTAFRTAPCAPGRPFSRPPAATIKLTTADARLLMENGPGVVPPGAASWKVLRAIWNSTFDGAGVSGACSHVSDQVLHLLKNGERIGSGAAASARAAVPASARLV